MTLTAHTSSADETKTLGAVLAELARPGDVVLLAGDLGAGKTALTQGFAKGLGVREPVTSPTFTLARPYEGRLVLHHLDVYRLDQLEEVLDIGLPELLDEGAVTVIEWGDAVAPMLPADFLEVRLQFGAGDDDRDLRLRVVGGSWNARLRALTTALAPWAAGGQPC